MRVTIREKGRRFRRSALMAGGAICLFGFSAAPAAVGQTTGGLAGYNLGATSAAVEFDLNSPGLLPLGDATTGNIFSVDLPFTRTTVSSGPSIDALGSPLYPGDGAAHLGTAIATFGGPETPNEPVLSEAQYPPTPNNKTDEAFSTPSTQNGAFSIGAASSESHASAGGANVTATVGDIGLGPAMASAANLVHIVGSKVTNSVQIGDSLVSSNATSTVTGINIAGEIQIASVTGTAGGTSDGNTGTPSAGLNIGKVTVAGQAAYIDQDGLHLVSQGGGGSLISAANTVLQNLAAQGVTIHTVSPTETTNGAQTSNNSGALVISLSGNTPTVPGIAPLAPGLPPTPGQPSVPFVINLLLGGATAAANASPFPTFPTVPTSGDFGSLPSSAGTPVSSGTNAVSTGGGGGVALAGAPAPTAGSTQTLAPTGPGASEAGAKAVLARVGKSVPVSLAILVFVLAIMSSGGLLGYARWQLIDGRRR
ncbi:MAG TPA: hypothetical protein VMO88_11555 [Acidimicrobiales bacterium]|nr:hypothetical protein [Acidimicrobiales bacterium]